MGSVQKREMMDKLIYYVICGFALSVGISRAGFNFFILTLIVVGIVYYNKNLMQSTVNESVKRGIFLFGGTLLGVSFFSADFLLSAKNIFLTLVVMLPVFVLSVKSSICQSKEFTERVTLLICISLLGGASVAVWQGVNGMVRAKSFQGVMDYAGIIGLIYPMLLVYVGRLRHRWENILFVATLCAIFPAILYNGTRSIWITVMISTVLYFLFSVKRNKVIALSMVLLVSMVVVVVVTNPVWSSRTQSITNTTTDTSNIQRLNFWVYALNVFYEHPLVGVGFGCMPAFSGDDTKPNAKLQPQWGEKKGNHVHNTYLQLLAETGLIGLAGFLYCFFAILRSLWKKAKRDAFTGWGTVALISTIDFLVHSFFDYTIAPSTIMLMYFFILGMAFIDIETKESVFAE